MAPTSRITNRVRIRAKTRSRCRVRIKEVTESLITTPQAEGFSRWLNFTGGLRMDPATGIFKRLVAGGSVSEPPWATKISPAI